MYSEDPYMASVASKLAEMIIEFEIEIGVDFDTVEDLEIDEEVVMEEDFVNFVEEQKGGNQSKTLTQVEKCPEVLDQINDSDESDDADENADENLMQKNDETLSELEKFIKSPNIDLVQKSQKQVLNIAKNMEKVSVAPGEHGKFQNWGSDTYLEEKCFPELFPFGCGGYLSSCVDNPERAVGFAEYCVDQIMSCDPKFRTNTTYIFFLSKNIFN